MSELDSSSQKAQYLGNILSVIEIANINDASAIALSLAEAYLDFDPSTTFKSKCDDPVFFLHTLWGKPNDQGIEQAAKELKAFLEECDIEILTSLRNVLQSARRVPSIREDLRDPCNINNLINAALLYGFLTSGGDWDEMEEWDCFDLFLSEAWDANDEERQGIVANRLQTYIESSSIESPESIFEALLNGRITTPNSLWDEA